MDFVNSISNAVLPKVNSLLASTVTVSSKAVPRDLAASGGSYIVANTAGDNSAAQTLNLLKKALGVSLASVAVMGSAFYVGYQFAKKRHRFHVRETDKNDQVSVKAIETRICIPIYKLDLIFCCFVLDRAYTWQIEAHQRRFE